MSANKLRVYALSGGPQDLTDLYLMSLGEVADFVQNDIAEMPQKEVEELEYTLTIKFMTKKQIENLPEYEF